VAVGGNMLSAFPSMWTPGVRIIGTTPGRYRTSHQARTTHDLSSTRLPVKGGAAVQVRDRGKGYGTLHTRPAAEVLSFWLSPLRDTGPITYRYS
jgi:hypothetical protein